MTIDYARIYRESASGYDQLVSAEDQAGNILRALRSACELRGADVLDVGVGTGRITRLLAPLVARLWGFDIAPAMLAVAARRLLPEYRARVMLSLADARALPVRGGSADVAVAGWVFGHFTVWNESTWRRDIGRALDEMDRALRPGGVAIVLETMGTGQTEPAPPTPPLAGYYGWLERERGFSYSVVRTDYEFATVSDAVMLTRLFFGADLATRLERLGLRSLPECTGVWRREVGPLGSQR